jgi:hypothetical protein
MTEADILACAGLLRRVMQGEDTALLYVRQAGTLG